MISTGNQFHTSTVYFDERSQKDKIARAVVGLSPSDNILE